MIQYNNKTDGIIYLPKTTHILISFSNTLLMYLSHIITVCTYKSTYIDYYSHHCITIGRKKFITSNWAVQSINHTVGNLSKLAVAPLAALCL